MHSSILNKSDHQELGKVFLSDCEEGKKECANVLIYNDRHAHFIDELYLRYILSERY